ncbi:MAG TPA: hypothetical protein VG347_14735 [Verrucomicrobiae bacterium]|nr:hypothetical protein [Verrucomicrobiae bacterium]
MINGVSQNGQSVGLSGTNGPVSGTYRILTATNLAAPAASWLPVQTNVFGTNGEFNTNVPANATNPAAFFRLSVP